MNYIQVNNLTNKYPTTESYKLQPNNKTSLFGVYTDINVIDFNLFDFENIIPIPNVSNRGIFVVSYDPNSTKFIDSLNNVINSSLDVNLSNRFISGLSAADNLKTQSSFVKQNSKGRVSNVASNIDFLSPLSGETNLQTKLFCSENYYNDLVQSKQDGIPYFINSSFKPAFVITINVSSLISLRNSLTEDEVNDGVLMYRHNFIKDNNIYYESLINYIDWVLTEPTLDEVGENSVIPANLLSEYERGEFDKKTGTFNTDDDQTSNTSTPETNDYSPPEVVIDPIDAFLGPVETVPIIPKGDKPKSNPTPIIPDETPALDIKPSEPPVIIRYPGPVQSDTTPIVVGEQAPENPNLGESNRRSTSQPLGSGNYSNPQDAIDNEFRYRERKPDRER